MSGSIENDPGWTRILIEAATGLASGLFGLVVGAWRYGRHTVKHEQKIKDDYGGRIDALRTEVRTDMMQVQKAGDARLELLVSQFTEAFAGLRRQIDDNKLHTEEYFLRKDAFRDFREEYRDDRRQINEKLDRLLETRQ